MCTLFIYRNKDTEWPLMLATNRDEQLDRKFKPPDFHWKKYPNIYAGKDLLKGGTWLGINKQALCVAILNRQTNIIKQNILASRGKLVLDALRYKTADESSFKIFKNLQNIYNNFNLFIGDNKSAYWIKFHDSKKSINKVPIGHSILDKFDLNDEKSQKQKVYKKIFRRSKIPVPQENNFQDWKKMLFMNRKYKDIENTQVFIYNKNSNYGTVSSSIIGLPLLNKNKLKPFWLYNERGAKNKTFISLKPY